MPGDGAPSQVPPHTIPVPGLKQQKAQVRIQQMQSWQAPFPPPDALERYEKIVPGTWERLLKMAEQAQGAQIAAEERACNLERENSKRGHYLGFFATIMAMGSALTCVYAGHPVVASVFLSVPVMSVAKALIDSIALRNRDSG